MREKYFLLVLLIKLIKYSEKTSSQVFSSLGLLEKLFLETKLYKTGISLKVLGFENSL